MEDAYFAIELDPNTNKKKVSIIKYNNNTKEYIIYSAYEDKIREVIDDIFNTLFEHLKNIFYIDSIPKELNIDLDEYYKIIKSILAFDYTDYTIFKREIVLNLSSTIKACYYIYKEIYNGNLDFEVYKRVFMELAIRKIK